MPEYSLYVLSPEDDWQLPEAPKMVPRKKAARKKAARKKATRKKARPKKS
jgi:hypothetical protein